MSQVQITTPPNDGGHLFDCYVAARNYSEPALFRQDADGVHAYLKKYAVIPLEIFEAMGGTDHPAFAAFLERKRQEFYALHPDTTFHG